jgi:hypothetical protein
MTASSAHDFDFLFGRWHVEHRRLRARLAGNDEWDEAWAILDGAGNIDDNVLDLPGESYCAASIRAFDATAGTWAIWWLDGRRPHQLDVPVVGAFVDGAGEFVAHDTLDGRPIVVRFRWSDTQTANPRWEQAFSPDGGATWETNWTMSFTRAS